MPRGVGEKASTLNGEDAEVVAACRARIKHLRRQCRLGQLGPAEMATLTSAEDEKVAAVFARATEGVDADENAAVAAVRRLAKGARAGVQVEEGAGHRRSRFGSFSHLKLQTPNFKPETFNPARPR